MYLYDEEISDILSAHAGRILAATLKMMGIAAIFCVGTYICSGWIPAIQATTIPVVVRQAAAAARQAGVTVAAAAQESWVESNNKEPQAPDRL